MADPGELKQTLLARAYEAYWRDLPEDHQRGQHARMVPGDGPLDARLAVVGEAPGWQENHRGVPFCGPAGEWLDKVLTSIAGIPRGETFVTNAVKVRPPGNHTPRKWEVSYGRPLLRGELRVVDPELTLLLGATALYAAFPDLNLSDVVGSVVMTRTRTYLPLHHPAACLRDPALDMANREYFKQVPFQLESGSR